MKHIWKYASDRREPSNVWIRIYRCDLCIDSFEIEFKRDREDSTNGTWVVIDPPLEKTCPTVNR